MTAPKPESVPITRKTIDAFYARWTPGAVVTCDANTYLDRDGGKGKPEGEYVVIGGKRAIQVAQHEGERWHITAPTKVGDVLALTSDSITYVIATRAPHTVTWRIVREAS